MSAIAAVMTVCPVMATAGVLDTLQTTAQSATTPWMNNSLQLATTLFSILIGVTFVAAIARYAVANQTIEGCGHMFMNLFIKIIPLYVIMASATTLLPNLVPIAMKLSGQITGTATIMGPDEVFKAGWDLCGNLIGASSHAFDIKGLGANIAGAAMTGEFMPQASSVFLSSAAVPVALFTSAVIMLSFTLISFELFFCFIQAYITLSIGAISLGWIAASGTKNMGEQYLSAAWASVMRIVITVACISLIMTVVPHMKDMSQQTDPTTMVMMELKMCSTAIFAALLAWKVPSFATNMFSGRPAVTGNEFVRSAANILRGRI
jgi:P-type conjugative transfer protein TrbL